MTNRVNYQKELERLIEQLQKENRVPRLLLHSCCAPCSSYCLEYLSNYFRITVFFYNPNIQPEEEYVRRAKEQQEMMEKMKVNYPIEFVLGNYEVERFYEMAKGLEEEPEGQRRCEGCFWLRLREAAIIAKKGEYDYFTTSLSISPHKNATLLNEIGQQLSKEYGVSYLPSDFKKKNGYKRSIELSKEFDLYRQDYCGCIYSKVSAMKQRAEKEAQK